MITMMAREMPWSRQGRTFDGIVLLEAMVVVGSRLVVAPNVPCVKGSAGQKLSCARFDGGVSAVPWVVSAARRWRNS